MNAFRFMLGVYFSLVAFCCSVYAADTVDVLVIYSDSAIGHLKEHQSVELEDCSAFLVQRINFALSDTNIYKKVKFRVVDSKTYNYDLGIPEESMADEKCYLNTQAQHLRKALRELTEIFAQYRDEAKADLVVYVADYPNRVCAPNEKGNVLGMAQGYSLVEEKEYIGKGKENEANLSDSHYLAIVHYSTLSNNVADNIVGHEIGHLLGCGHSDMQKDAPGPYYYCDSRGMHRESTKTTTIMGYSYIDEKGKRFERQLQMSSYPPAPPLTEEKIKGDVMHNNAMTALRNAPLVSHFRMKGKEQLRNINRRNAISLPPMVKNNEFLAGVLNPRVCSLEEAIKIFEPYCPHLSEKQASFSTILGTNEISNPQDKEGKMVWYKLVPPEDGCCLVGVRKLGTSKYLMPRICVHNDQGKVVGKVVNLDDKNALYCAVSVNAQANHSLYIGVGSQLPAGGQFSLYACLAPTQLSADWGDDGNSDDYARRRDRKRWIYVAVLLFAGAFVMIGLDIIKGRKQRKSSAVEQ